MQGLEGEVLRYTPDPVNGRGRRGSRVSFQWWCVLATHGPILDVGACNDPNGFGNRVVHFDYDDWSEYYALQGQAFVQGDAHHLTDYFPAGSYELVVLGDIMEHLPDPLEGAREAAKVTSRYLCMTIWEEWRGPGGDEQVAWAQQEYLKTNTPEGYGDTLFGGEYVKPADDIELVHWGHCQKFTDEDVSAIVAQLCDEFKMRIVSFMKAPEVIHEGHQCWNWLILLEKVRDGKEAQA